MLWKGVVVGSSSRKENASAWLAMRRSDVLGQERIHSARMGHCYGAQAADLTHVPARRDG
eukprot:351140-Chlamydomonas_euryale.AAC.13